VHRHHSARLANALCKLSHEYDARQNAGATPRSSTPRRRQDPPAPQPGQFDPVPGSFARRVADALDGSTLLYSNRLKLLQHAQRQGIDRFQANLIIAAVQQQAGPAKAPPRLVRARSVAWNRISEPLVFVLMQAVIVLALWYVLSA
jgi:hypothetical protein